MRYLVSILTLVIAFFQFAHCHAHTDQEQNSKIQLESASSTRQLVIRPVARENIAPMPFELVKGIIVFRAFIEGRPVWAALDSGAAASAIDNQFAESIGIKLDQSIGPAITSSGRQVERSLTKKVHVIFPGQRHTEGQYTVVDISVLSEWVGRPISLIAGSEYFSNLGFVISFDRKTIRTASPNALSVTNNNIPKVPVVISTDMKPVITALIDGVSTKLIIDTGFAGEISLFPARWGKIVNEERGLPLTFRAGLDGIWQSYRYSDNHSISISGQETDGVRVEEGAELNYDADGLIGTKFLNNYNLILNFQKGGIWLLPRVSASINEQ